MAIYNPPKQTATGGIMQGVGSGMMGVGGALTATVGGAVVGIPLMAAGAIASLAGTVINGNQEQQKAEYERGYAMRMQGDQNQSISANSVSNQSKANYTPQGVSTSIRAINNMVSPSSNVPSNGGTGLSNNRLI